MLSLHHRSILAILCVSYSLLVHTSEEEKKKSSYYLCTQRPVPAGNMYCALGEDMFIRMPIENPQGDVYRFISKNRRVQHVSVKNGKKPIAKKEAPDIKAQAASLVALTGKSSTVLAATNTGTIFRWTYLDAADCSSLTTRRTPFHITSATLLSLSHSAIGNNDGSIRLMEKGQSSYPLYTPLDHTLAMPVTDLATINAYTMAFINRGWGLITIVDVPTRRTTTLYSALCRPTNLLALSDTLLAVASIRENKNLLQIYDSPYAKLPKLIFTK